MPRTLSQAEICWWAVAGGYFADLVALAVQPDLMSANASGVCVGVPGEPGHVDVLMLFSALSLTLTITHFPEQHHRLLSGLAGGQKVPRQVTDEAQLAKGVGLAEAAAGLPAGGWVAAGGGPGAACPPGGVWPVPRWAEGPSRPGHRPGEGQGDGPPRTGPSPIPPDMPESIT